MPRSLLPRTLTAFLGDWSRGDLRTSLIALTFGLVCLARVSLAQSVGLPTPRLLTTFPMGGAQGTEVDVTLTGEHLDAAEELVFDSPHLSAQKKLDAQGQPVPNQYTVRISADCPPGLYETQVMTRLGLSSGRVFAVGLLPEVRQAPGNSSVATAQVLPLNSVCNAVVSPRAADHYLFEARQGQRIVVDCASRGIDSKLEATLVIADSTGRDLQVERRSGVIDFQVPQSGSYIIKVHELTFQGGAAFYYRLTLRELPPDVPVRRHPATALVSSFSWPPTGLAAQPATIEVEPNDDRPQVITLPADISGSFAPAADTDQFEFDARRGEEWWIEVASERLGLPTDPSVIVQQVVGSGAGETVTDVAEFQDIPSPVKVSSNGYAYDGPPYNAGSADVLGKLVIPQDGRYRLSITDLFGGTRNDPSNVYRLIIRKAQPDFAVVAWPLHMELRNGDRADLSKPFAVRAGGTIAVEVVALRRDGFDGPIDLTVEGLPAGVTAAGLRIPKGASRGIVAITAADDATAAPVPLTIVGRAQVAEAEVARPCRIASVAWPIRDHSAELPQPRLVSAAMLTASTAEPFPLALRGPAAGPIEAAAGSIVTIPITLVRRGKLLGTVTQLRMFGQGFDKAAAVDVPLSADSHNVPIDLGKLAIEPGRHTIVLYGAATVAYQPPPVGDTPAAAVDIAEIIVSEPIQLDVKPAAAGFSQETVPQGEKKS